LFGGMFAIGGAFFLAETALPTYLSWQEMQSWEPKQAQLLSVRGSENETKARYRYQINGLDYESDRVYVAEFSDNIGDYHSELYSRLNRSLNRQELITIWVNPSIPSEAVIDRDMRWGLFAFMTIFCSVFILIGVTVAWACLRPSKNKSSFTPPSDSELKQEWAERRKKPGFNESFMEFRRYHLGELKSEARSSDSQILSGDWKKRKGWETRKVTSQAKVGLVFFWIFTVFWNGVSAPVLLNFQEAWRKEEYGILAALLFPVIGIVLIFLSVKKTFEYVRFGKVLCELDPYPGAIGGHVGGSIVTNKWLDNEVLRNTEFKVSLECVYSYMSGSGKNRSRSESIKWAEEGLVKAESSPKGFRVP